MCVQTYVIKSLPWHIQNIHSISYKILLCILGKMQIPTWNALYLPLDSFSKLYLFQDPEHSRLKLLIDGAPVYDGT